MERQKKERVPLPNSPFSATRVLTTYGMASSARAPAHQATASQPLVPPGVCEGCRWGDLAAWGPLGKLQFYPWLFVSSGASPLKALRPPSPICKSWVKSLSASFCSGIILIHYHFSALDE